MDDLLLISNRLEGIVEVKTMLNAKFKSKYMGEVHYILGLYIGRDREKKTLSFNQSTYTKNVINKFNLTQMNPCTTPCDHNVVLSKASCPTTASEIEQMKNKDYRGLIGSLMYLMTGSRPDIAYGIQAVSKYLNNPGSDLWNAAKRILRYVKGMINYGLVSNGMRCERAQLRAFVDYDYTKDVDTRRSISGCVMQLGECAITYSSKAQRSGSFLDGSRVHGSYSWGERDYILT